MLLFINVKLICIEAHKLITSLPHCHQNAHSLILAHQLDQVCFESSKLHLYHKHSHGLRLYVYMYSYLQVKCQVHFD